MGGYCCTGVKSAAEVVTEGRLCEGESWHAGQHAVDAEVAPLIVERRGDISNQTWGGIMPAWFGSVKRAKQP